MKTKQQNSLAKQLLAYRSKHNLSQYALADKLGITRGYLSDLELGTKSTSIDTLVQIAKVIKSTPNKLLGF